MCVCVANPRVPGAYILLVGTHPDYMGEEEVQEKCEAVVKQVC